MDDEVDVADELDRWWLRLEGLLGSCWLLGGCVEGGGGIWFRWLVS